MQRGTKCFWRKKGRFLIVNAAVDDEEFCFVSIYVPNDQNQQITFYENITDSIRTRKTDKILIGGDFNCPLTASDKFGGKHACLISKSCNSIC